MKQCTIGVLVPPCEIVYYWSYGPYIIVDVLSAKAQELSDSSPAPEPDASGPCTEEQQQEAADLFFLGLRLKGSTKVSIGFL